MTHLDEERECPCCGKIFLPNSGSQKYCSKECSRIVINQNEAEKSRERDRQKKQEEYFKEAKKRRKVLININAEAKKEGLTYGQYVARHGLT